jgi:polyisoprenoid-binding protein YceI
MIRKTLMSAVCVWLLTGASAWTAEAASKPAPAPFKFDRAHTNITFSLSHFGFSTAYGIFKTFEPVIVFDPATPEKTKVEVKIDAASIDTGWPVRDDDMRSKYFFNVAQFPSITFKSTKVERTGEATATLTGDLTLIGVTKPLVLEVKLNKMGPRMMHPEVQVAGFAASGILKRSDFGMTTLLPGLGDEVTLTISAEVNNAPPKPPKN